MWSARKDGNVSSKSLDPLVDRCVILITCRNELRHLEEAELEEISKREKMAQEAAEEKRLTLCFVENLNGHQLFDSLFVDDESGRALLNAGSDAEELLQG